MRSLVTFTFGLSALCAGAVQSQVLEFPPSAVLVAQRSAEGGPAKFAVGPFSEEKVEFRTVEGIRHSQVWKVREPSLSTGQIAASLGDQLTGKGYEILFSCIDDDCGGYDFRYELDLVPEPAMHVDLGDFRFLTAWRSEPEDYLSLMISRTATGGLVQLDFLGDEHSVVVPVTAATPQEAASPVATEASVQVVAAPADDVEEALTSVGRMSLDDLTFATGSSDLSEGQYASLARLAAYLMSNPDKTVALVGHTDSEGSIAGNIALSKRRASSVLERLVSVYGVPRRQMEAEGVGYLSPRASNLTNEGRLKNRRVEVILTSTQ